MRLPSLSGSPFAPSKFHRATAFACACALAAAAVFAPAQTARAETPAGGPSTASADGPSPASASSGPSALPPDYAEICAGLGRTPLQHPYLAFSEADKPAMLAHIRADRRLSETLAYLTLEGRRFLNATEEPPAPPREPHSRFVGSDALLAWMERHTGAAVTLAFLYQMTGDARYAQKAFEHADAVCALESWVQAPHHFEVIYSRTWPYGARDDEVVFTYDITAAGVTRDLSYVYDWLYPALSHAQRDRIRGALLEKAITRVRGSYDYFWWADASKCNWTGICHSGLGLAALALLDEDPHLGDVLARSCTGVTHMLDHVGADGGWQEGRGYWAYGMGESLRFMDAIKRVSSGRINLFRHPAVYPHPVDFALFGMTAGFGDGTGLAVGDSFTINKLTAESGDPRAAWYSREFVRRGDRVFDLIWPPAAVKPEKPAESSRFFPSIDWAVMRKDFGPEFLTIACKAGMNDDPHHGHLDCGTFSLAWHNVTYVGEPPRSPYDEAYFGAQRWDHVEASTESHNVVLVNGEEQVCAKLKDEPWKTGIGGHIVGYQSNPAWDAVEMDPTHAYPNVSLKDWHRWIILDKEHNIAVVLDRVGCAPGSNIEVRFHPDVASQVESDRVVLHASPLTGAAGPAGRGRAAGGGRGAAAAAGRASGAAQAGAGRRESAEESGADAPAANRADRGDLEMVALSPTAHGFIEGREPDVPYTEADTSSWIPYFSTVLTAQSPRTWVASVFVPSALRARAGEGLHLKLDTDGPSPTLGYAIDGRPVGFVFRDDRVEPMATP